MENRNIYKMDDVLIIASFLMLIPTAFFAWPWLITIQYAEDPKLFLLSAPEILGNRLNTVILYGVGVVLSQLIGRLVRFKEKQSLKILDAMQYSRKTSVDELSMSTGISAPRIRTLVRKLARIPSLNISLQGNVVSMGSKKNPYERPAFHREDDRRRVGPEPAAERVHLQKESSHEASSHSESSAGPAVDKEMPPELEAIMKDKSMGVLEKIKKLQEFGKAHPEYSQEDLNRFTQNNSARMLKSSFASFSGPEGKKKRLPIFLIVFLFMTPLWPIALIIVIITIMKQRKKMTVPEDGVKKI